MQTLEKRITALEQANPPAAEMTIIRRIVSPGHLDAEIDHIRDHDGNEWSRQSGESEDAFTDRAIGEVKRSPQSIPRLIADTLELRHANP